MKWPGIATVEVSLITIFKGNWKGKFILNGNEINQISPFLDTADNKGTPNSLFSSESKSFQGSIVLGMGFILEASEAIKLSKMDENNQNVIYPYLSGDDLNNSPTQKPSKYVINFFDWEEKEAKKFPDIYKIIEEKVKPDRQRWKEDKSGNPIIGEYALRKPLPEKWWQHAEKRPALYNSIKDLEKVLTIVRISKYLNVIYVDKDYIYNDKCIVLTEKDKVLFVITQSTLFSEWSWKYGTTLGSGTLVFTPGSIYTPFPFCFNSSNKRQCIDLGTQYQYLRQTIMSNTQH